MIQRKTKDVYVNVLEQEPDLKFDVIFHDHCQKSYKFSRYEVLALRCSERDFIEHIIREYYESIGIHEISLNLCFI